MKIDDLVTALQLLAGWHIHVVSHKRNDTVACHTVRRLEKCERQGKQNVILATDEECCIDEEYPSFPPGIALLASNVVRVDWTGDRAWIEARNHQLGYFQRVRPIEVTEPGKGAQDAI